MDVRSLPQWQYTGYLDNGHSLAHIAPTNSEPTEWNLPWNDWMCVICFSTDDSCLCLTRSSYISRKMARRPTFRKGIRRGLPWLPKWPWRASGYLYWSPEVSASFYLHSFSFFRKRRVCIFNIGFNLCGKEADISSPHWVRADVGPDLGYHLSLRHFNLAVPAADKILSTNLKFMKYWYDADLYWLHWF